MYSQTLALLVTHTATLRHCEKAFIHPLHKPLQVPEIQYFGANALHTKISRYWSDIPTDQYESLKTQLFSQIACFSSGSKMVLTRLCVALASLALNTMPEAWPGAVAEMVRVFQEEGGGVDGRARCLALLELLTVLPEEFQTCRLPQYRKGQVRPYLQVVFAICLIVRDSFGLIWLSVNI